MDPDLFDSFDDGMHARRDGRSIKTNPYSKDQLPYYISWEDGWKQENKAMKKYPLDNWDKVKARCSIWGY